MIPGLHPALGNLLSSPGTLAGRALQIGEEVVVIAEIYSTVDRISEATESMAASFAADCYYGERPARGEWLEDITDFRHVLCIGHFEDRSPICLDTRHPAVPVITWDGFGWIQLSESAEAFARRLAETLS